MKDEDTITKLKQQFENGSIVQLSEMDPSYLRDKIELRADIESKPLSPDFEIEGYDEDVRFKYGIKHNIDGSKSFYAQGVKLIDEDEVANPEYLRRLKAQLKSGEKTAHDIAEEYLDHDLLRVFNFEENGWSLETDIQVSTSRNFIFVPHERFYSEFMDAIDEYKNSPAKDELSP